jgi:hypothetical protein
MKMKPETMLFAVQFGSHLYGTNGVNSDIDMKVVCLPALDDLLLSRKLVNRKEKPGGDQDKVGAGETETEYLPLQVFLDDYFDGQSYALEVANAMLQGLERNDVSRQFYWVKELVERFTTRSVDKMVGYAISQSMTYGLKTQRYTAKARVVKLVEEAEPKLELGLETRIDKAEWLLQQLLECDYVKLTTVLNAAGGTEVSRAVDVAGKLFPLTNTWGTLLRSVRKSVLAYGDRVKNFGGEKADWKALSHAIRITEQVLELCKTGRVAFPRPSAKFLKAVKEGQVPFEVATQYLTDCFNDVEAAVENSALPLRTPEMEAEFEQFKLQLLRRLYNLE